MASILEFQRHKEQFRKELFRRIGYTNTLYQIFRFGEIIKETFDLFPISQNILVKRIQISFPSLRDLKYARGIVDVLRAMNIIKRVGTRIVLTQRGRVLAAISQQPWYTNVKSIYFLRSIIDADGDYILNLLSLIQSSESNSVAVHEMGKTFFQRQLALLEYRKREIESTIETKLIREFGTKYLQSASDSIKHDILGEMKEAKPSSLEEKMRLFKIKRSGKKKRSENEPTDTVRHTIDPRRGWLSDLGLVTRDADMTYRLTPVGNSLLSNIQSAGFEINGLMRVPFTKSLVKALDIRGIVSIPDDYPLTLAIISYSKSTLADYSCSLDDYFADLRLFFELTRLKRFNQAEIVSLYECVALKAANNGYLLSGSTFQILLNKVLSTYGDKVYRVTGRYGREGYLAFRRENLA